MADSIPRRSCHGNQALRRAVLRSTVGRRVDPGLRDPPTARIAGVLGVADFQEREGIEVMPREPMAVLEEELGTLVAPHSPALGAHKMRRPYQARRNTATTKGQTLARPNASIAE